MDLSGAQGELPIPMHATSPYGGIGGHVALHHEHAHHHPMNGPSPPQPQHAHPLPSTAGGAVEESKKRAGAGSIGGGGVGGAVKYRECLKNHAAAIGGNATDGCGEFMPSGEEGSLDALKCSACGCHRNFHRKELDGGGDAAASSCDCGHLKGRRLIGPLSPMAHKGLLLAAPAGDPFGFAAARALPQPPGHLHHHHMVMPLSAMQTSESDEMDAVGGSCARPLMAMAKKRFRTKFTPEQKEKMLGFAEKVGWRLQKLEDGVVQQFCQEIGVKRRVLKVWMHNNKHNLAKKPHHPPPPPGMPGCRSPSPPPLQLE